ncbi:MAG: RHS repeat-associated core domain-containing protein [Chloroflexi bacterium]|nr:RHS repeat-associated core domain-containing protein [Chloroflexota bacterium]
MLCLSSSSPARTILQSDSDYAGEQDVISGMAYLRARFYDPSIGRFLTKDPFPGFPYLPSTLHPYTYAMNNPVNLVDPSGETPPHHVFHRKIRIMLRDDSFGSLRS